MKAILLTLTFFSALLVSGQATKTTATNPAKKPVTATAPKPTAPLLKSELDSVSYALGISLASYYKSQGISKLNGYLLGKAVSDLLEGKPTIMDNNNCNNYLNTYMTRLQGEKSKVNRETGEKFLVENKKRSGIITTESGLQYEVLVAGNGQSPSAVDTVTCHYRGTFIDGKGFDNSYDRGQPISFPLTGVIKGWTEGLQLMKVGAKYKFYVPYQLGYGEFDYMSIPGGSVLIFEVELIDVKKSAQ
jgi:FKBP-type peptidyl-prolyl cis-trans isomerase